jgi:hypothetical protein
MTEPRVLWEYEGNGDGLNLLSPDSGGDYRLTIEGWGPTWIPKADIRELMFALLRDHMSLAPRTVTPQGEDQ